jgi:WhiB family redox-sensing transcriptional regulator
MTGLDWTDAATGPEPMSREEELAQWWRRRLFQPSRRLSPRHRADLAALVRRGWQKSASCAQADPEAWFPGVGSYASRTVLAICEGCPVRRTCLAAALYRNERGIWAGTNARDRDVLYRFLDAGGSVPGALDLAIATPPAKLHTLGLPADGGPAEAA